MLAFLKMQPTLGNSGLQSAAAASAWLRSLPARDEPGRNRKIVAALEEVGRFQGIIDRDCIAAVELLDMAIDAQRRRQVAQYVANVQRSAAIADCIWQSMHEANRALIAAYRTALQSALGSPRNASFQASIPQIVVRLMRCFGVEAKLRAFRYQRLASVDWKDVNELYRLSVARGMAHSPVTLKCPDAQGEQTGATREYLRVLLVDRINTGNLSPAEFERLSEHLREWCGDLTLDTEPRTEGGFVIGADGKVGLVRRTGAERGNMLRFLDTTPLVARFKRAIRELSEAGVPAPESTEHVRKSFIAALEKTCPALAMTLMPELRCDPRDRSAEHAAISTGIAQVYDGLAHAIPEFDNVRIIGRRGQSRTNWLIVERSESSIRMVSSAREGQNVAVGTLIGIRQTTAGTWMLGVVRRVSRLPNDAIEAGVSILASRVVPATMHIERMRRCDMQFLVDGIDVSAMGSVFRGLYIPPVRRSDALSTATLIVPTSDHDVGRRAVMAAGDEVLSLIFREPIEQHADWTLTSVEWAPATPRAMA